MHFNPLPSADQEDAGDIWLLFLRGTCPDRGTTLTRTGSNVLAIG